ncbi:MAG: membrane protein insertase YidC [Oligoflexales bacterium]
MKWDFKSWIVAGCCFLGVIAWENYLNNKYPERFAQIESHPSTDGDVDQPSELVEAAPDLALANEESSLWTELSADELVLENDELSVHFDQLTGGMRAAVLKNYRRDLDGSIAYDMLENSRLLIQPARVGQKAAWESGYHAERNGRSLKFVRASQGIEYAHEYTLSESGYGLEVVFSWKNISGVQQELNTVVLLDKVIAKTESKGFLPLPVGKPGMAVVSEKGTVERLDIPAYCKEGRQDNLLDKLRGEVSLLGYDDHYFLQALLPHRSNMSVSLDRSKSSAAREQDCVMALMASAPEGRVNPGQEVSYSMKGWFGPKNNTLMAAYDAELSEVIDMGIFGALSHFLLSALQYIYGLVGNWGLAIAGLVILLKALFFPLVKQAMVSGHAMQKIRPQMDRIRDKYKDDPQTQQREVMRLMSENKVNPMKGCLPLLLQAPVFIALYRVLSSSVELRHAPFVAWIKDLSAADPYYITPILLGVAMVAQQKTMPMSGMSKEQERMMMFLPVMFTGMMLSLPAGMVFYSLTNTVLTIAQQQWLKKRLDAQPA